MKPCQIPPVLALVIVSFAFVGTLTAQQTNRIDEAQIHSLLKTIDAGYLKQDALAVGTNFADDAVISSELYQDGKKFPNKCGKKEFIETLAAGFKSFTDYSGERSDTRIEIGSDGQSAKVRSTYVERFRLKGTPGESTSEEQYELRLVGGNLRIKTLHSVTRLKLKE